VAWMALGKLLRYVVMTAGLLWVFPGAFPIG
jgi:membrane protein YqaA with SNARE-associated domain